MIRKLFVAALVVVAATACDVAASKGTDTGNGLRFGFGGPGPFYAEDAAGTIFEIREARANIDRIRLFLPGGIDCDAVDPHPQVRCNPAMYVIEGPFDVDLVAGTSDPPIEAPLPVGTYRRFEVRFMASDALGDRTLVGSGVFDDGGTETSFDFAFRFNDTARLEPDGGVTVAADKEVLASLDVSTWFSAVPITDCLASGDLESTDGRLRLVDGSGRCSSLESDIIDAVKSSLR